MSKREFTPEDFRPSDHPYQPDFVSPKTAAEQANSNLLKILAPYIEDLKAAREALEHYASCHYCVVCGAADSGNIAQKTLAAQKVKL